MSSPNTYRDITSADYFNEIRKHIAENKTVNTNQNQIIPRFILPFIEQLNITDAVDLNGNQFEFTDTLNLSDAATATDLGLDFRVTNDAGDPPASGTAIKMSFWSVST